MMEYLLFILGFVILIGGASLLIDGASSVGNKLGIPAGITGLTIVAIGTSLPELIINVFASASGNTDLAVSNVLGSNIINILVIVGITAILQPIPVLRHTYFRDIPFSLAAILVLFILVQDHFLIGSEVNQLNMYDGIVFILLLVGFLYIYYRSSKKTPSEENTKQRPMGLAILFVILGICGLYFGGEWIVKGAVVVASDMGMDQATIGLTIIAMATSLPELVTSIVASIKGNPEMAIGNAVGSCIFNILLVLGVSSLIAPLPFHPASMTDLIMTLGSTLLLIVFVYTGHGRQISRVEGVLMLLVYGGFLWYILGF